MNCFNKTNITNYTSKKINSRGSEIGGVEKPGSFDLFYISSKRKPGIKRRNWNAYQRHAFKIYKGIRGSKFQIVVPKRFDKNLNRNYDYDQMCFTKDGKTVFFTRREKVTFRMRWNLSSALPKWEICSAEIAPKGEWLNIQTLSINGTDFSVGHPCLSPDGKKMYYVSDKLSGYGATDLYVVDIKKDSAGFAFGIPINLGRSINTEGSELYPWVDESGNLFFATDGRQGFGGLDIFVAFPDDSLGFRSIMNLGKPINSNQDDFAFVTHEDGYSGLFASNRKSGKSGDDMYAWESIKTLEKMYSLAGTVTDSATLNPLRKGVVVLFDEFDLEIARDSTDQNGNYRFALETGKKYALKFRKKGYFDSLVLFLP